MMKKLFQQALFVIPIVALIAAPLIIEHKRKSAEQALPNYSSGNTHIGEQSTGIDFDIPSVVDKKQYAMSEPFAEQSSFAATSAMYQSMNPLAWMKLMFDMANYMQMTSIMQHMTAMPVMWMNPYMLQNPHQLQAMQQPMPPEEYEKWYQQQQELNNQQK